MTSIWRSMRNDRGGLWILVLYALVAFGLVAYVVISERAARPGGVLLKQDIFQQIFDQ